MHKVGGVPPNMVGKCYMDVICPHGCFCKVKNKCHVWSMLGQLDNLGSLKSFLLLWGVEENDLKHENKLLNNILPTPNQKQDTTYFC